MNFKVGDKVIRTQDWGEDFTKDGIYTVKDTLGRLKLEEVEGFWFFNSFRKAADLTKKEAIQAMLDGYKVRWGNWPSGDFLYFDDIGFYFVQNYSLLKIDINGYFNRLPSWEIYIEPDPKPKPEITLANGKKVTLSQESYDALCKEAK